MGQIDNKGFTIKEDGTIVRNEISPKINQMKKKLSSGSNRSSRSSNKNLNNRFQATTNRDSSETDVLDDFLGCVNILFIFCAVIYGAVEGYKDDGLGSAIVVAIVSGVAAAIAGTFVLGAIGVIYEALKKQK